MTGPRGLVVEVIVLNQRTAYKVSRDRYLLGDAHSVPELERLLARHGYSLADLAEDTDTEVAS